MDPNVISDQPGLSEGQRRPTESGADHLRRLRAQAGGANNALTPSPAAPFGVQEIRPAFAERRRSPRYQCTGSVEVRTDACPAPLWGTLADISLHGCYVEMPATFPLDTQVMLNIESCGFRFSTQATVRASYPSLGMGMCFTPMEAVQRTGLEELLKALVSQKPRRALGAGGSG